MPSGWIGIRRQVASEGVEFGETEDFPGDRTDIGNEGVDLFTCRLLPVDDLGQRFVDDDRMPRVATIVIDRPTAIPPSVAQRLSIPGNANHVRALSRSAKNILRVPRAGAKGGTRDCGLGAHSASQLGEEVLAKPSPLQEPTERLCDEVLYLARTDTCQQIVSLVRFNAHGLRRRLTRPD